MRPPRRPGSTPVSAITLRRPERSAITSPITARVTPKSTNRCRCDRRAAVIPPASPPIEVATSSTIPSRMFTSPRSRFTVEDADAVAITEMRLAAMAARMGTPSARVSRGTRKTPPPSPSSEPTRPAAPPRAMRSQGEKSITSLESYPETAGIEYAGPMAPGLVGIAVGLGPSLLGLLSFAVLLLLPGLLVVRAPWPAVPFLSLAFWVLSWGWLLGASREPFLRGALLAFVLLVLLRLFKPLDARRPGWPTMLVLVAAALPLAAFFLWPVCPGAEMSFHSLGARLLVWRDGLPTTYEPLAPGLPFGAHSPALPALAADVSLLSGLAPAKSLLLVHQAAHGLLPIALYSLLLRRLAAAVAALAAVLTVALARVPTAFAAFGDAGPLLALAFPVAPAPWP